MINRTVSHYRILEELGAGSMGVVYLAQDANLDRQVAIKFASGAADVTRFTTEAKLAAALNHPNIAAVYDSGEEDGSFFIVMELVRGEKLSTLLVNRELTPERRLEIIIQIADALAEAHRRKIIHRDIKPGNVIINEQGQAKVLDFGLAKQLRPASIEAEDFYGETMEAPKTQTGTFIGTWFYASPEQARGLSQEADERSDVFSLGVILYEALTGERPFKGKTSLEIAAQIQLFDPAPPSKLADVDPQLDRIVARSLAKQAADRYQNAGEMLQDLKAYRDELQLTQSLNSRSSRVELAESVSGNIVEPEKPSAPVFATPRKIALTVLLIAVAGWLVLAARMRQWPFSPSKPVYAPAAVRAFEKGTQFLREGDYHQASLALKQAIATDGGFMLAHARLAEALTEMDYNNDAQRQLNEVYLQPNRTALPKLDSLYLEATLNTATRKYPAAVRNYEELLRQAAATEFPNAHFDLGRAYEKNNEPQKAIEHFRQAINLDQNNAAPHLRLGVLFGVRLKDQVKAEEEFTKAETLFKNSGSLSGESEVFFQRGTMYHGLSQFEKARGQLTLALEKSRLLTNQYQHIKALQQSSFNWLYLGDYKQATKEAEEALALAKENRMDDLVTRGLVNLGMILSWSGAKEKADDYFNQAIESANKYNGEYNLALALSNRCDMHVEQGKRLSECLKETEQARTFFNTGGFLNEELTVLLVQARASRQLKDYKAAQDTYEKVIPLSVQLNDKFSEALALSEFGQLLMDQSKFQQALKLFEQRYEIAKTLGQTDRLIYSLVYKAEAHYRLGMTAEYKGDVAEAKSLISRLLPGQVKVLQKEISELEARLASSLPDRKR